MTLDEQLEAFDRYFDKAWARRMRSLRDPDYKAKVKAESRRRLIANHPAYGDALFHRPYDELMREEVEEDADAPLYRIGRIVQGWPT